MVAAEAQIPLLHQDFPCAMGEAIKKKKKEESMIKVLFNS